MGHSIEERVAIPVDVEDIDRQPVNDELIDPEKATILDQQEAVHVPSSLHVPSPIHLSSSPTRVPSPPHDSVNNSPIGARCSTRAKKQRKVYDASTGIFVNPTR